MKSTFRARTPNKGWQVGLLTKVISLSENASVNTEGRALYRNLASWQNDSSFDRAQFISTDLSSAYLSECSLQFANFSGAAVLDAKFENAVYCLESHLPFPAEEAARKGMLKKSCFESEILAAGEHHACVLTVENAVKCWGSITFKQRIVPPMRNPVQITAGTYQSCALDDDGVKCWGNNDSGQTDVPK